MENFRGVKMSRRIAIFGGSFDPIHIGHINLAISFLEKCALDLLFFIPNLRNPYKIDLPIASAIDRLHMIQLAIQDIPKMHVLDVELLQQAGSYTIDTVRILFARGVVMPDDKLFLVLGEDTATDFYRWKEVDTLCTLVTPLVGTRSTSFHSYPDPKIEKIIEAGRIKTALFDISSTNIRKRLSAEQYCGHMIQQAVLSYIKQNNLYK